MVTRAQQNSLAVLVRRVGKYALSSQAKAQIVKQKIAEDYATDVDYACETMILKFMKRNFPQYPCFSEEENIKPTEGLYWVKDPIDGTKNYTRGNPLWAVSIALYDAKNKQVLYGIVYFPQMNDLFVAVKDKGVRLNGRAIRPSRTEAKKAILVAELPTAKSPSSYWKSVARVGKQVYRIRAWGIAAAICYVANGSFDGYVDWSGTTKPFDIYASILIAQEAGCVISNFDHENINDKPITVLNPCLKIS